MWRLTKKRIALALTVPAIFLLSPGTTNANIINFDFTGELTGGEIVDFSLTFDALQPLTQVDQFTQTVTFTDTRVIINDLQFASTGPGTISQRDGTDGELFPDLWSFTSVLTEIGGNATFTITVQILDPSLSLIRAGVVISSTDLFLGSGVQPTFLLQSDTSSSTGFIIAALTSTTISEPSVLLLLSIGLAAIGLAARRKAS